MYQESNMIAYKIQAESVLTKYSRGGKCAWCSVCVRVHACVYYSQLSYHVLFLLYSYGSIAADGSLIPYPNPKKIQYRMYKVLMVQPDGSTYHIYHPQPYGIVKMPLDLNVMTEQQKELLKIQKDKEAKERADILRASFEADEEIQDDEWDHAEYLDLIKDEKKLK